MANRKIPPALLNYEAWPSVEAELLPRAEKVRFIRLSEAVRAACDGVKSGEIKKRFKVDRNLLSYFLKRCTSLHPDGRMRGFRALVVSDERESYVRTAELKPGLDGRGLAGAFGSLLRDCPNTAKWLHKRIKPANGTKFQPAGLDLSAIHQEFLEQLRKEGRRSDQYPFNVERKAYESLCAYVRKRIAEGDDEAARARYGDTAIQGKGRNSRNGSLFMPYVAFERAAYDEWKLPNIGTVTVIDDGKEIAVPLNRLWFCPIVCFRSHAVLGYSVSMPNRFGSFELLAAYECAIQPRPRIPHKAFDDLEPLPDEGLPAAVLPQAVGRRICCLVLDNHLTHLANRVVHDLRQRTGVSISFGKIRSWIERFVVEGLFSEFAIRLKKLPSTTGSGPKDPAVRDPVGNAVRFNVRLPDLLALLDQLVCRHNAQRRRVLMSATPHEMIASDWAEGCALDIVPRYRGDFVADPCVAVEVEYPTVRGSREHDRTPYVQLDDAEYTNDVLKQSWSLVAKKTILRVHIRGDYRTVRAYRMDGTEFGVLYTSGRWAKSPHTRATRKEIIRLQREGILDRRAADPVDHMNRYLAREALKKSGNKRRPKITREANLLAQSLSVPGGAEDPPSFTYNLDKPISLAKAMAKPRNRRAFFSPGSAK